MTNQVRCSVQISLLAIALSIFCLPAVASPTNADFMECHERASSMLRECLNERPGHDGDACWVMSRDANRACYRRISESDRPSREYVEAVKQAEKRHRVNRSESVESKE